MVSVYEKHLCECMVDSTPLVATMQAETQALVETIDNESHRRLTVLDCLNLGSSAQLVSA